MSLARNVFVQTGFTLGSRVLGFARDLAANARFGGQGPFMDAFATALMFPNLFRRLFAEGAFAQAFVPVYAKERTTSGDAAAAAMASETMSFLMCVVAAFCILAQIAMPYLTPLLLSAYIREPETMRVATLMTQLTMPYLACMTLASLLSGVLNTAGRFGLSAGVPIILNICTIAPLLLAANPEQAAIMASAAVTIAGIMQAGLLWWGAARLGVRLRFGLPRLTAVVRRVLVLALPGAIAGGATQLNSLISQFLTGGDQGARSVLYNADRLYQLPLGLIGVAVGLALTPRLARFFAIDDKAAARSSMDDGVGLSMAFTLPAAVALLVMPVFIIDATVTRGAFTSEDARRTGEVLRHFAWGVPAFVLAKVFTPPFFARQLTAQPMRYALISVAVSTVLGATLFFSLPALNIDGVIGLAIATSAAAWLNVVLLASKLARDGVYTVGASAWARVLKLCGASLAMGAFTAWCAINYPLLRDLLWTKEVAVLAVVLVSAGIYAVAAFGLGAVRPSEIRSALRREQGPTGGGDLPGGLDG
ncbi:murein biosynthesis integral membrane protein MurJ [bacterium]|nr:murein biosynthesis integral membrane protein MurJ [bacterium]